MMSLEAVTEDWEDFGMAIVSAPPDRARDIARQIVEARLAACAQVTADVTSIYWWKGRIEEGGERLILLKTRRSLVAGISALLAKAHPYEVPELTFVPMAGGSPSYLGWLRSELP